MKKRPNKYEAQAKTLEAFLNADIINIEATKKATGLSRARIVKNLPQIRETLKIAYFCYTRAIKQLKNKQ